MHQHNCWGLVCSQLPAVHMGKLCSFTVSVFWCCCGVLAHRAAPVVATLLQNLSHCLQGLLGGLSNVVECLRGEGAPPPAVRAVVHAALHYVDAELLNALVLRRDCCSISAIKALQVCNLACIPSKYSVHDTCLPWLIACNQACMR